MADYVTSEELQAELEQLAEDIGVGVDTLVKNLKSLIDTNTGKINTNTEAIAGLLTRMDAIDKIDDGDDVVTIAEKLKTLNDMLSKDGTLATDLLQRVADNKAAVNALANDLQTEVNRAKDAEGVLGERIDAVKTAGETNASNISNLQDAVTQNKQAADTKFGEIDGEIAGLKDGAKKLFTHEDADGNTVEGEVEKRIREANTAQTVANRKYTDDKVAPVAEKAQQAIDAINVINGDENTEGSIAYAVKEATGGDVSDLKDRMTAAEDKIGSLETAAGAVDGKIATAKSEAIEAAGQAADAKLADVMEDKEDADGNVVKGVKTRITDLEAQAGNNASAIAEAKAAAASAQAEAEKAGLKKGVICGRKAANKFMAAVGLPALEENCPGSGDDL